MSNNFDIEKYAAPPKKRCFFYAKNLRFRSLNGKISVF